MLKGEHTPSCIIQYQSNPVQTLLLYQCYTARYGRPARDADEGFNGAKYRKNFEIVSILCH